MTSFTYYCPQCARKVEYKRKINYNKAVKEQRCCQICKLETNEHLYNDYVMEVADSRRILPAFVKEHFKQSKPIISKDLTKSEFDALKRKYVELPK